MTTNVINNVKLICLSSSFTFMHCFVLVNDIKPQLSTKNLFYHNKNRKYQLYYEVIMNLQSKNSLNIFFQIYILLLWLLNYTGGICEYSAKHLSPSLLGVFCLLFFLIRNICSASCMLLVGQSSSVSGFPHSPLQMRR